MSKARKDKGDHKAGARPPPQRQNTPGWLNRHNLSGSNGWMRNHDEVTLQVHLILYSSSNALGLLVIDLERRRLD